MYNELSLGFASNVGYLILISIYHYPKRDFVWTIIFFSAISRASRVEPQSGDRSFQELAQVTAFSYTNR